MKMKKKRLFGILLSLALLLGLLPGMGLTALAFNVDNYKAQIEQLSIGELIVDESGAFYLPMHVYFSAAEDLSDANAVYFLEGYLKATLANGTTTEGIAGLGMTLMPTGPDDFEAAGSNAFRFSYSEGEGTGIVKYKLPLLGDGDTQTVEKSTATGQVEVNGLKKNDKVTLQIETVLNSGTIPADMLPPAGSVKSDEFTFTVEDRSKYPKTVTESEESSSPSLAGGKVTAPAGARLVLRNTAVSKKSKVMTSSKVKVIPADCAKADPAAILDLSKIPDQGCKLMLLDPQTNGPLCESWEPGS